MLKASDFRAEKGRVDLTIEQISEGAKVSPNTVVRLLDEDKNKTVTLAKARQVMDYMKQAKQQLQGY